MTCARSYVWFLSFMSNGEVFDFSFLRLELLHKLSNITVTCPKSVKIKICYTYVNLIVPKIVKKESYSLTQQLFMHYIMVSILNWLLLLFLRKIFFWGLFFAFFYFLLQKDFDIFHVLLFEFFLCFFDNIQLSFLYREKKIIKAILLLFFNWDSLHVGLSSHYEAWSYKKKKHKKIKVYQKSAQKESTVKRCLLILDLKPLRPERKAFYRQRIQEFSQAGKKKLLTQKSL